MSNTGGAFRLPAPMGRWIDRERPIAFRFEGATVHGFAGDSISSALAANGIWTIGRSFKYHRPRGPLTLAGRDANALVQIGDEPNAPADRYPIREGMEVLGQHYRGSLVRDRGARIARLVAFLPVGFYYRAFFRPLGIWQRLWEPMFRARAGLGRVTIDEHHREVRDKIHRFCDVAVVGGGPAGLSAAIAAAEAGAEVTLIDENPVLGGSLGFARCDAAGQLAEAHLLQLTERLRACSKATVLAPATCTGLYADHWLSVIHGEHLVKLRARQVVLACGALEQPAVFRNNDLPGVLLGAAAQRLIRHYGVKPGRRAVVLAGNDAAYGVALDLADAGVEVALVADLRNLPSDGPLRSEAARRTIAARSIRNVDEAQPDSAGTRVGSITLDGERFDCDLVCMSVGYAPEYHLAAHAGAQVMYDEHWSTFVLQRLPDGVHVAGSVNGVHGSGAAAADGDRAGRAAARALGCGDGRTGREATAEYGEPCRPDTPAANATEPVNMAWPIYAHPRGKEFFDFDEDLTLGDVANTVSEGYAHVELFKRFSTAGMGPSQGRQSTLAVTRLIAKHTGQPIGRVGVTTARPPVVGERMILLAGRNFQPERQTPMHERHLALDAQMFRVGPWWRPAYYGTPAERELAVEREVAAVHDGVGMIDVSTLGKIEVRGPDAAAFVDRVYTLNYANQPVGRVRYLLMLNEAGTIVDDGVAARLGEQRFFLTATTGGADGVFRQLLWWNAQWRLRVDLSNVTAGYAAVNLAGPRSRELLAQLHCDIDVSPAAFPYLAVREGHLAGMPARLLRIGFVGELGYEIYVPSQMGEALWDALSKAGDSMGIRAVGIEAQRVLRIQKGHIVTGQDTDGLSTPAEVGMQWALGRGKAFFVGARSLELRDRQAQKRRLVGFTMAFDGPMPREGCLVVEGGDMTGAVTSVARSRKCNKVIGLAYVRPERSAPGTPILIRLEDGRDATAEVAAVPFYDPQGTAQQR